MNMRYIACIDMPDPDNFIAAAALCQYSDDSVPIILTQRPLNLNATQDTELFESIERDSLKALEVGASRMKNFLRHFSIHDSQTYYEGIAPITPIPHIIHFQDYYKFREEGYDPVKASEYPELEPLGILIKELLDKKQPLCMVVGGPLTGLMLLLMKGFRKYKEALEKRGEWIYIHDLAPVISVVHPEIYEWTSVSVDKFYIFPHELQEYGRIDMSQTEITDHDMLAYKIQSSRQYLDYLYSLFE